MTEFTLRNGDQVTSLVDDEVLITKDLRGKVLNHDSRLQTARVEWDNETISIVKQDTIVADRWLELQEQEAA